MKLHRPHFLVVGPAKTGTTWLYEQLKQAEGFEMPPVKEVNYFNEVNFVDTVDSREGSWLRKYEAEGHQVTRAAIKTARNKFINRRILNQQFAIEQERFWWSLFYRFFPRNTGWLSMYLYSFLFSGKDSDTTGDISPLYFPIKEEVIALIARNFPEIKIVFILRDPIEREWSNIRMNYYSDLKLPGFNIDNYLAKMNRGSDYEYAITNWEKHFSPHQIRYLFYDELVNDPKQFMQQFIDFVKPGSKANHVFEEKIGRGVEKEIDPELRQKLLVKNVPQYHFLAKKFGEGSYPARWLEAVSKEVTI